VGLRLARRLLAQGNPVTVTRRSEEACESLQAALPPAQVRRFALGDQEDLAIEEHAVVVISSPPGSSSPAVEGAFAASLPDSVRLLYISTTGVYAAGHGEEVDDTFALAPGSPRGQARLDTEVALASVHPGAIVLRVPGIYGPHRGVHERLLAGNYRLIGEANTLVGRIHVDDLVSALLLLGESVQLAHTEYIIGDDCPTSGREHALGVAQLLHLAEPPTVDPSTVSTDIRAMLSADRRIVPRRLHALGWRPAYPSWREGLVQALTEEGRADLLG
jgi:nucleoside-diphosphate-sugar epimerase